MQQGGFEIEKKKERKREGGKDKKRKKEGKEGGIRGSKMRKKCHGICIINRVENITDPSYWTTMGTGK